MKVKLVASDLDGTIIDKNNKISYKNFEAKAAWILRKKSLKYR